MTVVVGRLLESAARRTEKAEVLYGESETSRVSFKAGKLHEVGIVNTRGVGARVFVDGRVGYASTTDLASVDDVLEAALAAAKYGRKAEYDLPDGTGDYAEVKTYDEATAEVSVETMVDVGEQAVEVVKGADDTTSPSWSNAPRKTTYCSTTITTPPSRATSTKWPSPAASRTA